MKTCPLLIIVSGLALLAAPASASAGTPAARSRCSSGYNAIAALFSKAGVQKLQRTAGARTLKGVSKGKSSAARRRISH